jgi:anti-anti-sigma factor
MNLVQVTQSQGSVPVTILALQDRVNMGNTAELEKAARDAFAAGARNMLIDLSKVPSLTSAGIRSIVDIYKMLAGPGEKGKHLKLACPTPYVRQVLEIAGILDTLEVFESLEQAVASF